MPVCLRPNKTFPFALAGDESIPLATRPHFVVRYISAGKRLDTAEKLDTAKAGKDAKLLDKEMNSVISDLVAGMVNFPAEMTLTALLPELTYSEKWELIYGALNGNEMKADEIKNSVSP